MDLAKLSVSRAGPESVVLLKNLFAYYLHDMSRWFAIDTEADGSFAYDVDSIWDKGYEVYVARVGDAIAGFALTGTADQWLDARGIRDVHEFFVLSRYRRCGVGRGMAALLWDGYPGEWLVRVLEFNAPAVSFWREAVSTYTGGSYQEEGRLVNGRSWRFLRFSSPSR